MVVVLGVDVHKDTTRRSRSTGWAEMVITSRCGQPMPVTGSC